MFKRSVVLFLALIVGISLIGAMFVGPKIKRSKIASRDKIAVVYVDGVIALVVGRLDCLPRAAVLTD